ncbi:YihY/virulence factor BrkB family protein [Candidatus Poribacteria bacterium]|nr:YihY/virulence factor BrkB family protein [Candidatus Poribacteria bacterium]
MSVQNGAKRPLHRRLLRMYPRAFVGVWEDDVAGFATQMAYNAMFSIFPGLLLLAALVQRLGTANLVAQLMRVAERHLPREMMDLVQANVELLVLSRLSGVFTLGTSLVLLWVASNFMNVFLKSLSVVYREPDTRSLVAAYFVRRAKALAVVVVFGFASALSFNLFVFGGRTARLVESALGLANVVSGTLDTLRWPLAFIMMTFSTMLLYMLVPSRSVTLKRAWPGALTFSVFWIAMTGLFSAYVTGFAHYSSVYGAIAGLIMMMTWFYLSSLLLLFGAEVNAAWAGIR